MKNSQNIAGSFLKIPFTGGLPVGMASSVTGSTTLTNSADGLTYSGGSGNVTTKTEYIELTQAYWCYNVMCYKLIFKPITTGLGFSLIMKNIDDAVTTELYFNISTGAITCTSQNTTIPAVSYSYIINEGIYELSLYVDYQGLQTSFGVKQKTNVKGYGTSSFSSFSFPVTYNPKAYNARVVMYGGSAKFYSLDLFNTINNRCDLMGLGDSNMGSNAKEGSWFNKMKLMGPNVLENFSWGGARASQIATMVQQIIDRKPKRVVINLGTNDMNQGQSVSAVTASITTIVNALIAANIKVDIISVIPSAQGFGVNVPALNSNLSALANGTTVFYIDTYTSLVSTGTTPNPALYADNLHMNAAGIAVFLGIVVPYYSVLGFKL